MRTPQDALRDLLDRFEADQWYTPRQVADVVGGHPGTVKRAAIAGELAAVKFGGRWRVMGGDVREWIAARSTVIQSTPAHDDRSVAEIVAEHRARMGLARLILRNCQAIA